MKVQSVDNSFISLRQEAKGKVFPERRDTYVPEPTLQFSDQTEDNIKEDLGGRKLEEAVEQANKTLETYGTELRFSIHEASGEVMVKVVNTKDNSTLREIPPERVLDFVAHVKKMLGIIIDKLI